MSGELAVTVTGFADASKLVTVFPDTSLAVSVFVPVNASPSVCGLAAANTK